MPRPHRRHRQRSGPSYDPTLSRGIFAIFFFILAVLITLSFFGKAGDFGIALNEYLLASLLGAMRYALPVVLLIIAWYFMKDIDYDYRATHGIGVILFLGATASLIHLRLDPASMWVGALGGLGGGIVGMPAYLLKTYVGIVGSLIILLGLTIVSVFLMFNTSLAGVIMLHKKIFGRLGAVGNGIIQLTKSAFTKSGDISIHGAYMETAGENGRQEEAAAEAHANGHEFVSRRIGSGDAEDDAADAADESETPETDIKPSGPWTKKVVIKNLPTTGLLSDKRGKPTSGDIKSNAQVIQGTLKEFGVDVDMGEVRVGPTVTQYSLKPHKGVKLSRITTLSNDLALALAAHPIRIEAPIPGKSLVGIEVPNQKAAMVGFKELLESKEFQTRPHAMMIALGKDVAGKVWWVDLPRMPHLLIAGATGSGKTVCVNAIIMSLLFQNTAETLRFIMVDPKRVELTLYNGIPHLLTPVITNVQKTINSLRWTIGEMERRFEALAAAGNRDINSYNVENPKNKMPHIVFVIDELADLMAAAAGEVEAGIIRLAQMARAVGIHLVVATQRPSVDVITGLIKANIPARIAFSVVSLVDSRTILDASGAEKLLGRGDMLFQTAELSKPVRIQGAFISEEELKGVVDYLQGEEAPEYDESIVEKSSMSRTMNMFGGPSDDLDPLFQEAKMAVILAKKASTSFLQRKLGLGYARAARIMDQLETAGVIGPGDGAKPREILLTDDTLGAADSGGELNVFDDMEEETDDLLDLHTEDGEDQAKDEERSI